MGSVHGKCIDESDNDSNEIQSGGKVKLTSSTSIFFDDPLNPIFSTHLVAL